MNYFPLLRRLHTQLILLALLPCLLLTVSLALYLNYSRHNDLDVFISERGKTTARQFAVTAKQAIAQENFSLLQAMASASLEEKGMRSLSIIGPEQQLLAHAGPSIDPAIDIYALPKQFQQIELAQTISFILPISSQALSADFALGLLATDASKQPHLGWVIVAYNNESYVIHRYENDLILNSFFVLSLCLALILGLYLSHRLVRDLNMINDSIRRFAKDKRMNPPSVFASQEMQLLAANLKRTANSLNQEFEEMRHSVELTTSDLKETIETIEIQNIELNIAKKAATEASAVKSEFLANTSHEVRTPLNGIIGFTKLLQRTALDNQQRDYLQTIQQSSDGLLRIINDILDFSKIEAGKLELDNSPFVLHQCFDESIALFAPQAYEKGIEIASMIYSDVPHYFIGDALRIKQIINNLLSNAIKFTQQGQIEIRVSLESENEQSAQISIAISDTGIGMQQEQQDALFEAFTQANSSISRQYGGTGLGLNITKNLIALMHGNIHVESSLNQGSKFSFTLSLNKSHKIQALSDMPLAGQHFCIYEQHVLSALSAQHQLSSLGAKASVVNNLADFERALTNNNFDAYIYAIAANFDILQQVKQLQSLRALNDKHLIALIPICDQVANINLSQDNILCCAKPMTAQKLMTALKSNKPAQAVIEPGRSTKMAADFSGLRILIADDQAANLKLLSILLHDLKIQVVQAHDGQQAVSLAEEQGFDLIFMDIQMPQLNGIDACKRIRQTSSLNQHTPIIALTANAQQHEADILLNDGFSRYLTKPINEAEIHDCIHSFCSVAHSPDHSVIDLASCLALSNNKADLAVDMLQMLLAELPGHAASITQLSATEHWQELQDRVHKLHGACCYSGVPTLKIQCQLLENLLNGEPEEYAVNSALESLLQAIGNVLKASKGLDIAKAIAALAKK